MKFQECWWSDNEGGPIDLASNEKQRPEHLIQNDPVVSTALNDVADIDDQELFFHQQAISDNRAGSTFAEKFGNGG